MRAIRPGCRPDNGPLGPQQSVLNTPNSDERRQSGDIAIPIEVSEQFDVAPFVDVPVVLMGGGILGGDEYQVGVQPGSPSVPVSERMNADTFGVGRNAQFAGSQVFRVDPAVPDVVHGGSQFDSDQFLRHSDIDLA